MLVFTKKQGDVIVLKHAQKTCATGSKLGAQFSRSTHSVSLSHSHIKKHINRVCFKYCSVVLRCQKHHADGSRLT